MKENQIKNVIKITGSLCSTVKSLEDKENM